MKLMDLNEVSTLRDALASACDVLMVFEAVEGDTVDAIARSGRFGNYGRGLSVPLLPVAKSVAISAAMREVSKLIDQLRSLGVEVEA